MDQQVICSIKDGVARLKPKISSSDVAVAANGSVIVHEMFGSERTIKRRTRFHLRCFGLCLLLWKCSSAEGKHDLVMGGPRYHRSGVKLHMVGLG